MKIKTREEIVKERISKYRKELGIGTKWVSMSNPTRIMLLDEVFHDNKDGLIKLKLHVVGNRSDTYIIPIWGVMNGNLRRYE